MCTSTHIIFCVTVTSGSINIMDWFRYITSYINVGIQGAFVYFQESQQRNSPNSFLRFLQTGGNKTMLIENSEELEDVVAEENYLVVDVESRPAQIPPPNRAIVPPESYTFHTETRYISNMYIDRIRYHPRDNIVLHTPIVMVPPIYNYAYRQDIEYVDIGIHKIGNTVTLILHGNVSTWDMITNTVTSPDNNIIQYFLNTPTLLTY